MALKRRVRRATTVAEDVKQPRLEALALLVARQCTVQSDERLLHNVFGVVGISQHRAGESQAASMVRLHDRLESVDVTEFRAANCPRVENGGLSGALQRETRQKVPRRAVVPP